MNRWAVAAALALVAGGCFHIDATDSSKLQDTLGKLSCTKGQVPLFDGDRWTCATPGAAPSDTLAGLSCKEMETIAFTGGRWSCVPPSMADLLTRLTCADGQVVKRVSGQWTCGTISDTLGGLSCADGQIAQRIGGQWSCGTLSVSLIVDRRDDMTSGTGTATRDLQAIVNDLRDRVRRLEGPVGYVRIPAGRFTMGSPPAEPGRETDEPQHTVVLTRAFWLKATEVTQQEWCDVMGCVVDGNSNPSNYKPCPNCPVEQVSWNLVVLYLNKLSRAQGLSECYSGQSGQWTFPAGLDCGGYRLPTEAEWEYAARAATSTTAFYNGQISYAAPDCLTADPKLDAIGWYCKNGTFVYAATLANRCMNLPQLGEPGAVTCGGTNLVRGKLPNAWGLFDMHGNVVEWTNDAYAADPTIGCGSPCTDPSRPSDGSVPTVVRGGGFNTYVMSSRAAWRNSFGGGAVPITAVGWLGFRPALTVR